MFYFFHTFHCNPTVPRIGSLHLVENSAQRYVMCYPLSWNYSTELLRASEKRVLV